MIFRFSLSTLPEVAKVYAVTRRTVWQIADPYHILLYIQSGSCTIEMDGETFLLQEGDLFLIPENSLYIRRPVDNKLCTMHYAHFHLPSSERAEEEARAELRVCKEQMDTALLHDEPLSALPKWLYLARRSSLPDRKAQIEALFAEAESDADRHHLQRPVQLSVIVCHLLMLASGQTLSGLLRGDALTTSGETPEKLRRAVLFLRQHYAEKISLEDLCRFCAVSRQQMIRYFHACFQTTPTAYITRYKINKARELFINAPQLSVKEVSAELGFEDPCYFSRVFTRTTGESPTAYRQRVASFDEKLHVQEAQTEQK